MCEATVYLARDDNEEQIMRDVILLRPEGDKILLATLLGDQRTVRATIDRIDFLRHTVYLTSSEDIPTAES